MPVARGGDVAFLTRSETVRPPSGVLHPALQPRGFWERRAQTQPHSIRAAPAGPPSGLRDAPGAVALAAPGTPTATHSELTAPGGGGSCQADTQDSGGNRAGG